MRDLETLLRQLTVFDSICCPKLSLPPILILFGVISITSELSEPSYQISRPGSTFKYFFAVNIGSCSMFDSKIKINIAF